MVAAASDRDAILALVYGYSDAIDRGDYDALAALFRHGDFVMTDGQRLRGEGLAAWFRDALGLYDDGTPRTTHSNPSVVIQLDDQGATATARTSVLVFQALEGDIRCIYSGLYDDEFERHPEEGWCFLVRRSTTRLVGDMSHHLT